MILSNRTQHHAFFLYLLSVCSSFLLFPASATTTTTLSTLDNVHDTAGPHRALRLAPGSGGLKNKLFNEWMTALFLGVAIGAVFCVGVCVIRCNCARVCPCLCGDELLESRKGKMKGEKEEEEEDIMPTTKVEEEGGGRVASVSVSAVGGGGIDEAEEETKDNGGNEEAAAAAAEGVIKSLSSSLLALVGMGGEQSVKEKEKEGEGVNVGMNKVAAAAVVALEEESKEVSSV